MTGRMTIRMASRARGRYCSALAVHCLLLASPAVACTFGLPEGFVNQPTRQGSDCTFDNAGPRDEIRGGPLTVIGSNIYQLIDNAGSWSMMAANCYSLDVVIVHGSHVEGKGIPGCLEFTDIRQDLYPGGPLDVGKLGRPIDVMQAAQELGLKVSLSTGYYDQFGVEDSFNPFCGCAEAVPDSAGATAGIRPVEREEG